MLAPLRKKRKTVSNSLAAVVAPVNEVLVDWHLVPDFIWQCVFRNVDWQYRKNVLELVCRRWHMLMPYDDMHLTSKVDYFNVHNSNNFNKLCQWLLEKADNFPSKVKIVSLYASASLPSMAVALLNIVPRNALRSLEFLECMPLELFEAICRGEFMNLRFLYCNFNEEHMTAAIDLSRNLTTALPCLEHFASVVWCPLTLPQSVHTVQLNFVRNVHLFALLQGLTDLQELELKWCTYDLQPELPFLPALVKLCLLCDDDLPGAKILRHLGTRCPMLQCLTGYHLCESVKFSHCMKSLKCLHLYGMSFDNHDSYQEFLRSFPAVQLTKLCLSFYCKPSMLQAVAKSFPNLKSLLFECASNFDGNGLDELFAGCQHLQTVHMLASTEYKGKGLQKLVSASHSMKEFLIQGDISVSRLRCLQEFLDYLKMEQPPRRNNPINLGVWYYQDKSFAKPAARQLKQFGYQVKFTRKQSVVQESWEQNSLERYECRCLN